MIDDQPDVTESSLQALADDFDAGKTVDVGADKAPPAAQDTPDHGKPNDPKDTKEGDSGKETDTKDGPADSKDSKDQDPKKPADEKQKSKWAQNEERKAKTWQEVNAEKDKLKAERETLQREREEFQKAKVAPEQTLRDEHGATAKDYRDAAKKLRAEGNAEYADAAEKLASNLDQQAEQAKAQRTFKEGAEKWQKNFAELTAKNPDLAKVDSEVHKTTLAVLEQFPLLKKDPEGIRYAVRAAEFTIQAREFDGTKAELTKLKAEHEKLTKKLSISGGPPTDALPDEKSFDKLSHKEMGNRLEHAAAAWDRDNGLI